MNSQEYDETIIEIDDDVWDVVYAMIALVCEVNGQQYFFIDDHTDHEGLGEASSRLLDDLKEYDVSVASSDSERSDLRLTTAAIVWNIIQAVSETFSRPGLHIQEEVISTNCIVVDELDPCLPNSAILKTGTSVSKTKQDEDALDFPQFLSHQPKSAFQGHESSTESLKETLLLSNHKLLSSSSSDNKFASLPSSGNEENLVPERLKETLPSVNQKPSSLRFNATESEYKFPSLSLSGNQDNLMLEHTTTNIFSNNSAVHEKARQTSLKMRFVCENDLTIPVITDFLLDIATSAKSPQPNHNFSQANFVHGDLLKMASTIRFSCFENEKDVNRLFSGLSLLHILCIHENIFVKSIYDYFIGMGCKPDQACSNGCNVYAFAACQGNFEAMKYIRDTHSNIWSSTLCRSQNTDRNVLHCIMDYAIPSNYDSLFECLGPSVCSEMCKAIKGDIVPPLVMALKLGNYAFIQSISKQIYIWNLTTANVADERTFLFMMMTSPHAHVCLLQMIPNITSLESFVVQSNERPREFTMMLQSYQMGHRNIVFHILKQQHVLYFMELDKVEPFIFHDKKTTRSGLISRLSFLLEKHHSNTVVLWHCIHLVIGLSHDEEMALDLLSIANIEAVKNHHHWRSFDRFTGESALHIAAKKGWTEILSCLYDLGHDINPFCFMMQTPMHSCALHNSVKCIMLLNKLGAEASIESGDGISPIACSLEAMNIECSMEILNNVGCKKSLFRTDSKGLSPLMRALELKHLQVAHKILKMFPEQANFVSMSGTNIFHAAAPHLASVQQLVSWSSQEGKDIWAFLQQKNNGGETPKDIAAHCGYLDSLRFFMQIYQAKGSVNAVKSVQEMDVQYSESKEAFSQVDFSSSVSVHRFLSNHSDSIDSYDFYHRTPIILAVQAKNLLGAQHLVDAGADILKTDALGNSVMHYMFLTNREQSLWMWEESTTSDTDPSDVLQCIIQRNSEDIVAKCLTLKNNAGITPFGLAVMNEFYIDVALLCGEAKFPKSLLNIQLPNGTYCLHVACSKNLVNLVVIFLNLGSNPSVFDSNGMSPEYIARSHGHNSITLILMQFCNALKIQCAVRGYLCRVHALTNRADCIGIQNVVFSIIEDTTSSMQQYSDLRVNFPRANWNALEHPKHPDIVPMAYAAMCNNSQALKFILDLKMDPNIRGKVSGSSPLAFAVERGSTDCIKLLLAAKANANNCDNKKRTPVHYAAEKGFLGSLKILGEYHPNYNALDENQCSPMMLSLTSGSFLTSKPLIECSSETMNVPCYSSGNTPLLEAIFRSADMDVIKAILTHGGEVLVTNNNGQTALSMSLAIGNTVLEFIFRELLVWCNGYRELRSLSIEERSFFVDIIFEVAEIFESSSDPADRHLKLQDLTRMASKNHRFTSIEWLLSPSTGGLEFLDISSCLLMACDSPVENLPIIVALIKFRKKCTKRRPIMEYVDTEGRSVLHICALRGHLNSLTMLINETHYERAVCFFDMQDACGKSPFFLACQSGHIEVVKNFMQYSEVNLHLGDATGGRPIVAALINGHLDVVASILEVDPTLVLDISNNGTSILHIIAARDEYLPLAIRVMSIPNGRSLLGCARHTLTENGTVESSLPIDIAVKYDAVKMVSLLRKMSMSLQEKRILNLQTQIATQIAESSALLNPETAKSARVIFTRDSLHRKSRTILVQSNIRCHFARLNLGKHRKTFLLYCRRMLEAIVADDVQAVNYILGEWPALIRIFLKDGLSALYLACENAASGVLDYLLAKGIDVNEVNQRNRNCLHYSVLSTVAPFVRKVAALQVSHSLQDHQGNTPLHLACINGDSAVADELLYLNSAPLSVENKEKLNPNEVAIIHGHDALARKLVETKKHSIAHWDDFGAKTKFSSKVEADWISIRQKATQRKAVTQLQCVYRNYASRNILRLFKMKHHFRNQAAILIKMQIKTSLARMRFFLNTQANILQRNWRVHRCLVLYILLKEKRRIVQARLCIYHAVKMNVCRSMYRPHKAASSIQRVFCGHVSRKPYRHFVDKGLVRKRNFFCMRLQSAYRQHTSRKIFRLQKIFFTLSFIFTRFIAFRKFGPDIQFLSQRRWVQHITRCAKSFLQRRNYGVKIGNIACLGYYLPQILLIQSAYSFHKHISIFRVAREQHNMDLVRQRRFNAACIINNNCRAFKSKQCLKFRKHNFINFNAYLLQYYVFNKMGTEKSLMIMRNASIKIANAYKIHTAKIRVDYLKGEPMRREKLYVISCCVSMISRHVRCFLAKLRLKFMTHEFIIRSKNEAAICIVCSWRCCNARKIKTALSVVAQFHKGQRASLLIQKFMRNHAKNYKKSRQIHLLKRSALFLSTYIIALCARNPLYTNSMLSIIQRSWRSHRARMVVRKLHLRRLQGISNPRKNGKGNKTTVISNMQTVGKQLNAAKTTVSRQKSISASQETRLKKSQFDTLEGDRTSTADAEENIAICESEYDLDDKAQVFSRYVAQGKATMYRSDSFPLSTLEPVWKEARSSSRPSSSASVRHYISCTVPSELGLGTEHRGNIKRLLEAKSFGENDFFPAPRFNSAYDRQISNRPSSSASSRASSRPSSSLGTSTLTPVRSLMTKVQLEKSPGFRNVIARPVWLNMIILTGAAALHDRIESPFNCVAFENATSKNNPQLALQIAESNLTTARTSQTQEHYDVYILAMISFSIVEAIKFIPDKSDSSCLILLQIAEENIRARGQHLEDKNLLRVWCLDALSMYYYHRNKYHAAEEAVIKAIRCVDHRLSNENHCILLQHAALIRLRIGKPKEAESSARRALRIIYPSFDPDVSSDAEAAIPLPPTHSLGLVGSLLNFCFILHKTAQLPKARTSLNVSIHLLQEMMPFQSAEALQLKTLATCIEASS